MTDETFEPIVIYTDGACVGNPGPGGWAYLKTWGGVSHSASGGVAALTTNIQMEMVAVIQALRSLTRPDVPVIVRSDLEMISKGMNEWVPGWAAKGWRNSAKKPVANRELWEELVRLRDAREEGAEISFKWVRGHSGVAENEEVDRLAEAQARKAATTGQTPHMQVTWDETRGLMIPAFPVEKLG